jgi:penicillin-binding protein 1C
MKAVTYAVRLSGGDSSIPLIAAADGDVRELTWFIGDRLLGKALPRAPLLWTPEPGRFVVRAVDDHGRSDSRDLVVTLEK